MGKVGTEFAFNIEVQLTKIKQERNLQYEQDTWN